MEAMSCHLRFNTCGTTLDVNLIHDWGRDSRRAQKSFERLQTYMTEIAVPVEKGHVRILETGEVRVGGIYLGGQIVEIPSTITLGQR